MEHVLDVALMLSLVVFVAGNLSGMGLRLRLADALVGLRDLRFVGQGLLWGFALAPALAWLITKVVPLEAPYALGLLLIGMTPCAPFLPTMVERARGDKACTASFLLLASLVMVFYVPVALPLLAPGLSVTAWTIGKPLLAVVLGPLALGMWVLHTWPGAATRLEPIVRKVTVVATGVLLALCALVYGTEFAGSVGSYATLSQVLFLGIVTPASYVFAVGLSHERRVALSLGVCTRNLGAAFAPLVSVGGVDQRAIVMVALGVPVQMIAALVTARIYARIGQARAAPASTEARP